MKQSNQSSRHVCYLLTSLIASAIAVVSPFDVQASAVIFGSYTSVQVNVDQFGQNIPGDLGNEPTIALNPINSSNMVVGWRLRSPASTLISAGSAFTLNQGSTWQVSSILPALPNQKRTDPALDVDSQGNFYFQSYATGGGVPDANSVFKSINGGASWGAPVYQFSGDRNFITIDRTGGVGDGNIYSVWSSDSNPDPAYIPKYFVRSTDQGVSYQQPIDDLPVYVGFGRMTVGPEGEVYISGRDWLSDTNDAGTVFENYYFLKSLDAKNPSVSPTFSAKVVDMGGRPIDLTLNAPNPRGGMTEVVIAADHSQSVMRGNIYMLTNVLPDDYQSCDLVDPESCVINDIMDIHFVSSSDGGETWSLPVRVNDDPAKPTSIQWFPMMGVAPNSRIDAVWYDTRNGSGAKPYRISQLYYSYSWDGGVTWSPNKPITPEFNTHLPYDTGTENQRDKLGDYAQLVSDANGAHVAYAATFNGEQDVYYLNVFPDCNNNAVSDILDIQQRRSGDTNGNHQPDVCENITVIGDIDSDKDVDQLDINLVNAAKNKPASGPSDPRDLDHNGIINLLDARKQTLLCTRPRCAV